MIKWFENWNECGQAVVLFTMAKMLPPTQARFLSIVLNSRVKECTDLKNKEIEANNPAFVLNLQSLPKELVMKHLLLYVPLLQPGNLEARNNYLNVIFMIFKYSVQSGSLIEESLILLTYILIHPALKDDRRIFEVWQLIFDQKLNKTSISNQMSTIVSYGKNSSTHKYCNNTSIEMGDTIVQSCKGLTASNNNHFTLLPSMKHPRPKTKQQRSGGLSQLNTFSQNEMFLSQKDDAHESLTRNCQIPYEQSHSGYGNKKSSPLSPRSHINSNSSTCKKFCDTLNYPTGCDSPELKGLYAWLKSLRLHKYYKLFSLLKYEQILSMNEDNFDAIVKEVDGGPVTKGARGRIIINVGKLNERYSHLCRLEQDVISGCYLFTAINSLKAMLVTPIKAAVFDNESWTKSTDIANMFMKVLKQVCIRLMSNKRDKEFNNCFSLLDKVCHHNAFTLQQKMEIILWKSQIQQQHGSSCEKEKASCTVQKTIKQQQFQSNSNQVTHISPVGLPSTSIRNRLNKSVCRLQKTPITMQQSLRESGPFFSTSTFKSSSLLNFMSDHSQHISQSIPTDEETEVHSRLQSLCLSMTQQVLSDESK